VRQFAVDLLRDTGATIPPPDKKFWDDVALTAACEALPAEDARPDVIVVDEAQDFEQGDWMLVEQLAGKRDLWVFRDTRQAFWTDRPLPEALAATLGGRFMLPTSYRCPTSLSSFAESYVSGVVPTTRPPAQVLKLVACADDQVQERTRHEVETLLRQGVCQFAGTDPDAGVAGLAQSFQLGGQVGLGRGGKQGVEFGGADLGLFKQRPGVVVWIGGVDAAQKVLWQAVFGLEPVEGLEGRGGQHPAKIPNHCAIRHGGPRLPRSLSGS
jgi:hypothetical protein